MNRVQGRRSSYGYVEGSAVRRREEREFLTPQERSSRRHCDKARYMNLAYVCFLCFALFAAAYALFTYVEAQSRLTISTKNVAALESQLNSLKISNDEELNRINASINMEEIKRVAIEELGMTYAKEGQVVVIESEGSDYVRQLRSLE